MSNKCPKCGEKLSPLYMKQNCPKCNTNLVYYDLENRLKADHEQAMKEQEAVDRALNNIKSSAFGGPLQIIRFVLMFSPLLWMCLPTFKSADRTSISLISVIMGIINGSLSLDQILSDKSYLFPIVTMVCIILFSLFEIIASLFSVGEKAIRKIRAFAVLNRIVFLICFIVSIIYGADEVIGFYGVVLTYLLTALLHNSVDKMINPKE